MSLHLVDANDVDKVCEKEKGHPNDLITYEELKVDVVDYGNGKCVNTESAPRLTKNRREWELIFLILSLSIFIFTTHWVLYESVDENNGDADEWEKPAWDSLSHDPDTMIVV